MSNLTGYHPAAAAFSSRSTNMHLSFPGYEPAKAISSPVPKRSTDSPFGGPRPAEPGFLAGLDYGAFTREEAKTVIDGTWGVAKPWLNNDHAGKLLAATATLLSSAPHAYAQLRDPHRTGMEKTGAVIGAAGAGLAALGAAVPHLAATTSFQILANAAKLLGIGCTLYVDTMAPEPALFDVEYRALKPSA